METKEKKREPQTGSRPASKGGAPRRTSAPKQAPRPGGEARRPAAQSAKARPGADGSYEVYVPDAQSQRTRHAEKPQTGGAKRRSAPPAQSPKRSNTQRRDSQYRPYRQANQRMKEQKRSNLKEGVNRFFSYRNPVLKYFHKEDPSVFGDDASEVRRRKRAEETEKKRKRAERLNTPATIYTQPMSFNSRRLAVQLTTILAVVLALVLGMSVFFKVEYIAVVGTKIYSDSTITDESGIQKGDNLLTFGRTKASGKIIANLPYVKSARIGIKLPDTVIIEIEEDSVVYSIQDQDGVWWLINSDGKVVEQTSSQTAKSNTQVQGVTLFQPQPGETGVAAEEAPTATDESGEVVQPLVTGAQRLNAALKILQALEQNDIVGDAASVDVSQLQDIILWYGTQYQVNLGSISSAQSIEYKISYMKSAISQMSDYQTGILDVSFTTWTDQAGYTPFA